MGHCVRRSLILLLLAMPSSAAAEVEIRLRLTWGGGASQIWDGAVTLSDGDFSRLTGLGLAVDSPGSLSLAAGEIHIRPRSASAFHGLDVDVRAPESATLHVLLGPRGERAERFDIPLADLVEGRFQAPLDNRGNVLALNRAPGDQLHVRFDRSTLVFAPGEKFDLLVEPRSTGLSAERNWRMRVALAPARGELETWAEERERRSDAAGEIPPARFEVPLPEREGVYDIRLSIIERRLQDRLFRPRPSLERTIQVVVVAEREESRRTGEWNLEVEFDPSQPRWWERFSRWMQLRAVTGSPAPADNGNTRVTETSGSRNVEIGPQGWQTYTLPVTRIGAPHLLEIEFPQDRRQALGISIVETNAAGDVVPVGLDSGVQVTPSVFEDDRGAGLHRLVFWPRTSTPLVLLTNQQSEGAVRFRTLRLFSRNGPLPSAEVEGSSQALGEGRLLAAHFEKPLFTRNFGADQALDAESGRCRDDWVTFHEGGHRLVEYLSYAGYNGAVIPAYLEGSTLYPSELLQPTPKYDTGVFFSSGQDPLRKDVLELLFRQFNREGYKLIPSLNFSTPLPALEEALRRNSADRQEGLLPLDREGLDWIARHGTQGGLGPYYNPLHPKVQEAILAVVAEVAERYGHHRSFGGVALQLGPHSYLTLPGPLTGLDDHTIARFEKDAKVDVPGDGASRYAARAAFLAENARPLWLDWKAKELAGFQRRLRERITQHAPQARLYLSTTEFGHLENVRDSLQPALPRLRSLSEGAHPLGIAPKPLATEAGVVLFRPRRIGLEQNLLEIGPELEITTAADSLDFFSAGPSALLLHHEPVHTRLESFDAAQPLRARHSLTWLVSHLTPSGAQRRKGLVESLAARDTLTVAEGGWLLPLGQEDACRDIYTAFAQLPLQEFSEAKPTQEPARETNVLVRRLNQGGRSFYYVVNAAPWPVEVELTWEAAAKVKGRLLGSRGDLELSQQEAKCRLIGKLRAYDFAAVEFNEEKVELLAVESKPPAGVKEELARQVGLLASRIQALREPIASSPLRNPGFEAGGSRIAGWVFKDGPHVTAEIDATQRRNGEHSLRLVSQVSANDPAGSVIWVRSEPLDTPPSGRLALKVWLRVADPRAQPPFRLAIEGKVKGKPYYRAANVGLGPDRPAIGREWSPFIFPLAELPVEITDLRIGFDLMGPGEVWIDDVELFDLWFHENERAELTKIVGLADYQLGEGRLVECARVLDGYWPRYLTRFVPAPVDIAASEPIPAGDKVSAEPAVPPTVPGGATSPPKNAPSVPTPRPSGSAKPEGWFDWMRRIPERINPF